MTDERKLEILIDALRRIVASDPGPAYHIAKTALDNVNEEYES